MSTRHKQNFNGEIIPDPSKLINKIKDSMKKYLQGSRFSFSGFYSKSKRNEFVLNRRFVDQNFKYNSKISKKSKINNEIKGIYILYERNIPKYAGISKTILRRIKQHFTSRYNNQASLAYLIAREKHEKKTGVLFSDNREKFPFKKYRKKIQSDMQNMWKILIIPETKDYKAYLYEWYLACKLKTYWNTFETH